MAFLTASNHRRGFTRRKRLDERLESVGVTTQTSVVDQVVTRDEVQRALGVLERLRPQDREIIQLSSWEHLTATQIAEVLSITPEATTQRLHRARKRLTREYERSQKQSLSPAAQKRGEW